MAHMDLRADTATILMAHTAVDMVRAVTPATAAMEAHITDVALKPLTD